MRFLLAAAATAVLALAAVPAEAQCPVLDVKTTVRKVVNGGKPAQLTVRVTNRGLALNNGGLMLTLPAGMTYSSVRVSPKLSPAPGEWAFGRSMEGTRGPPARSVD